MTEAGDPRAPKSGLLAVLWGLVRLALDLARGCCDRRALKRRLIHLEADLAFALFGGGLAADRDYQALSPDEQAHGRYRLLGQYFALREGRRRAHLNSTLTGRGYRRATAERCARRFERRIASRSRRRLGRIRLAHVSATPEPLAGAPP